MCDCAIKELSQSFSKPERQNGLGFVFFFDRRSRTFLKGYSFFITFCFCSPKYRQTVNIWTMSNKKTRPSNSSISTSCYNNKPFQYYTYDGFNVISSFKSKMMCPQENSSKWRLRLMLGRWAKISDLTPKFRSQDKNLLTISLSGSRNWWEKKSCQNQLFCRGPQLHTRLLSDFFCIEL